MQKPRRRSASKKPRPRRPVQQAPVVAPPPEVEKPSKEAKRRPVEPGKHSSLQQEADRQDHRKPHDSCGCEFTFNIQADGDIHINNYCAPPGPADGQGEPGRDGDYCAPVAESCIPVVAGAKHKQGRSQKMAERASRSAIPSVLAASTIHAIRRYVAGAAAANSLEQTMFETLDKMPKEFLRCTVDGFDSVAADQRAKLFAPLPPGNDAWDLSELATAFATEIKQRTALAVLGDPLAVDGERPGLNRLYVPSGEDFTRQVRICRVNQVRTSNYIPPVPAAERLPAEYQQECTIEFVNETPVPHCELQLPPCDGNLLDNACARVIEVTQGDTVELEGVNYFDIDAKVRLTPKDLSAPPRDIDAFVWGDVDTPLNEQVGSETWLIRDCRVHDRLTFEIPNDLAANTYAMEVVVPNSTGNPAFGTELVSDTEYLNVLPSPTARYQIMIEKVDCREETWPEWPGSDEVGLRAISTAMDMSGNLWPATVTKFTELDGVDFDSGTHRTPKRPIFQSDAPFLGMAFAVIGHEVDSEWAYNRQIDEWTDYFIHLLDVQKEFLLALITAAGGLASLKVLGWKGFLIALIAAGAVVALDLLIAIWGPADPIIDDLVGLSAIELDQLVSPATPVPPFQSYASQLHIRINVNRTAPPPKLPFQYFELREYLSAGEMSRYELTLQYNRLA
ncbi:MAG TPA: hypothetical protein VFT40_08395 [Sphingomicrobium sp.]|nr:hypothetical protein [Sphingomicrobium sp.]